MSQLLKYDAFQHFHVVGALVAGVFAIALYKALQNDSVRQKHLHKPCMQMDRDDLQETKRLLRVVINDVNKAFDEIAESLTDFTVAEKADIRRIAAKSVSQTLCARTAVPTKAELEDLFRIVMTQLKRNIQKIADHKKSDLLEVDVLATSYGRPSPRDTFSVMREIELSNQGDKRMKIRNAIATKHQL